MNTSEILLYETNGNIKIDVILEDETVWLTQEQLALLFGKGRSTITEHIRNIFKEGELDEGVVCRKFRHTTQHGAIKGKTQDILTNFYNLDLIIFPLNAFHQLYMKKIHELSRRDQSLGRKDWTKTIPPLHSPLASGEGKCRLWIHHFLPRDTFRRNVRLL